MRPDATPEGLRAWLLQSALPLWWSRGADHVRGGFHDALEMDGAPAPRPKRARVQTRQAYVYAVAGRLGWQGPWREAAEHALDFFTTHFLLDDGLYRTRVQPDGAPIEEAPALYDQAFALFAFAEVYRAMPDRHDLPDRAAALLNAIEAAFGNPHGGFSEPAQPHPCGANPHMHLLEAALAWSEVSKSPLWPRLADDVAELCLARFVHSRLGVVREFFTCEWSPAAGLDGRHVEPGHQFEWGWLLDRWGEARGRADARSIARRLYAAGRAAVDPDRGVAVNVVTDTGELLDGEARLWPQTEWIKAALRLADAPGDVGAAIAALTAYLDVPRIGLWRDRSLPGGGFVEEPAPASSFYHVVGAIAQLSAANPAIAATDAAPARGSKPLS